MPERESGQAIITNLTRTACLLDLLRSDMLQADQLDVFTTDFEVAAFITLDPVWRQMKQVRILIGQERAPINKPEVLKHIRVNSDRSIEAAKESDDTLSGMDILKGRLANGEVQIRTYLKEPLDGAAYLLKLTNGETKGYLGSSNFAVHDFRYPIELNVSLGPGQANELAMLFERLFPAADDVGSEIMKHISRHDQRFTPFDVYMKSLYEYFSGRELEVGAWEETESALYPLLSNYQRDGYRQLLRIASRYNGALLCDGVGLGKTFVALMLIERMLYERKRVAVIVPKSTRDAVWESLIRRHIANARGVFGQNVVVYNHTDLLRGPSVDRDFPAEFEEIRQRSDVIIVDEAHNFRSSSSQRAQKLFEITEGKQVFLLTATPVNNSLFDMQHLIEFFTRRNDARFAHLGINSIRAHLIQKEKIIKQRIEEESNITRGEFDILEAERILKDDRLFGEVVVQRSRAYVMAKEEAEAAKPVFPQRVPPTVANYELSASYQALLNDLRLAFDRDDPLLKLAIYYPMAYAIKPPESSKDKIEANRQKQVVGLVRTTMLKRFESSWKAFQYTCEDLLLRLAASVRVLNPKKYEQWHSANGLWMQQIELHAKERYESDETQDMIEEDDLLDYFADSVPVLDPRLYNIKKIVADSLNDMFLLVKFLSHIQADSPNDDTKLQKLLSLLRDDPFLSKFKAVIFTEFKDTARYLGRSLKEAGIRHVEQIDSGRKLDRLQVIRRFAPFYNYEDEESHQRALRNPIRVLVSTDVLSEGLNLQDGFLLINYDLHWNPVRLMQRIGRVDRRLNLETEKRIIEARPEEKGQRGTVRFWNFLPPTVLNDILSLYNRVSHKVLRISETTGLEGEQLLTPEDHYNTFRNFNAAYVGQPSLEEELRLILAQALLADSGLEARLLDMPHRVFSARLMSNEVSGLFACYRLPIAGGSEDPRENTDTRWYFLPDGSDRVLSGLENINAHISATPQVARIEGSAVAERRKRLDVIERHIRANELKQRKQTTMAQVATGGAGDNRLQLMAWMEILASQSDPKAV